MDSFPLSLTRIRSVMKVNRTLPPIAVLLTVLLVPAMAQAAGICYLPGVDRSAAVELDLEPSLALLTWELPGGLLVVDRTAEGEPVADGLPIAPVYPAGEWFLVDARVRRLGAAPAHLTLNRLEKFGAVHRLGGDFALCEVPAERLSAFLAAGFDGQRIPTGPPPEGWKRYGERVATAVERRGLRADPVDVAAFVAFFDEAAFQQILQEISGAVPFVHDGSPHTVSTRHYDSADKHLVGDYLFEKLVGYGYTVEFDDFIYNGTPCRNVVATKIGVTSPDEYVVVGGHYDSTSEQPGTLAPGAEDNGSGSSLVMEVARMAAALEFDRSVQFVLFDAEEVGLVGSEHFVDEAVSAGRTIVSAITADMVCFYDDDYGVIIEGEPPWESLMTVMEEAVNDYTTLSSRKDYISWGSDHVPFQQAGIPAFLAIDWDWDSYPYYHQSTDSWANLAATAHIGSEITQACAATLAEVAGLQPMSYFRVSPFGSFDAEGQSGGPFTPARKEYTVENAGELAIDYTVSKTQSWITLSSTGGTLAPGATENVTVSLNSGADALPDGAHTDTVSFVNMTDHDGDTSREVNLQVGVPVLQYEWNMDTDPGWLAEGLWAWGTPTGGGGQHGFPDPTSGATGTNVCGYNLSGDYPNGMPETHLTTTAIDCTGLTDVSVRFQRYLNVESATYDHAYLRVSNDGTSWTTVWENSAELTDAAWTMVEYDISGVADEQDAVYLRWTQGTTDGGWQYSGWNIDDVQIRALGCPGCAPPPIPDGSSGTSPMRASRIDAAGRRLQVSWDDQCAPATTKIVYGPLSDVSTWTITDAVCTIDNPERWASVPTGDLWFLLIAENVAGTESSWGEATAGERNGMVASNTCGSTEKDLSATCP
jgi:hypothetical protein